MVFVASIEYNDCTHAAVSRTEGGICPALSRPLVHSLTNQSSSLKATPMSACMFASVRELSGCSRILKRHTQPDGRSS